MANTYDALESRLKINHSAQKYKYHPPPNYMVSHKLYEHAHS